MCTEMELPIYVLILDVGSPRGVVASVLDCDIKSYYYFQFRTTNLGKGINPFSPSYKLNRTATLLLEWCHWHYIIRVGRYTNKQRHQSKDLISSFGDRSGGRRLHFQ